MTPKLLLIMDVISTIRFFHVTPMILLIMDMINTIYIYIYIIYIYIYGDTHDFAGYGYNKQHYMIVHDALYRSNLCNYMLWYVMVA